jgi:AcrR family transcriptional regulator
MTQRRTKDEVVSEFRREEILEAAHRVFAKKTFREATVDDIAAAAGVAKGTVYLYFRSKDDLYWAALHQGLDRLHANTATALDRAASARGKVRAFVETKVRYFDENGEFFRIYFAEFGNITRVPAQKHFERRYLEQVALLEQVLAAGVSDGSVRPGGLNGVAFAIVAVTHNVVTRRMRGWSRASIAEDVDAAVDLLWTGLSAN